MAKAKKTAHEHVCTRKCLRSTSAFGRRFYYCALVKPIVVRVPGIQRAR
jgi:hypothetical protein